MCLFDNVFLMSQCLSVFKVSFLNVKVFSFQY